MYPHLLITFNVSRETKISTVLTIENTPPAQINEIFGHFPSTMENCVYLCNKYFNLHDYGGMLDAFKEHLNKD